MTPEKYKIYLKSQISSYEKYEKEDVANGLKEAAYKAKIIKESYIDALEKFEKVDLE